MADLPKPPDHHAALLQHLPSVYLLAQAVSPTSDVAARLVEATYVRAFNEPGDALPTEDDATKQQLFALLMQVRRETPAEAEDEPTPGGTTPVALYALRQRLAEQFVDRVLPTVLATLPGGLRVLLLLCDVEGLSCAQAAEVLTLSPEEACTRLEQARVAVRASLRNEASLRERHLLDTSLGDAWLAPALRRAVQTSFTPPPPTLRPVVAATSAALTATTGAHAAEAVPDGDLEPATEAAERRQLQRFLFAILFILTAGVVGYLVTDTYERVPETNVITLSAEQAGSVPLLLGTNSPEQAERFVQRELGWRLTLPTIDRAHLTGVGIAEMTPGARVPVFLYDDNDGGDKLVLYVYTYALLQRFADRLRLAPDTRRQIEDNEHFDLHDLGEQRVLVWRNRDDIFVAVTSGDASALRARIVFPS